MLRVPTDDKAPGRVEDVPAPYASLRCSNCGWIEKNSRKSQAEFVCVSCGFACNADVNAAINVAAGHAGGATPHRVFEVVPQVGPDGNESGLLERIGGVVADCEVCGGPVVALVGCGALCGVVNGED